MRHKTLKVTDMFLSRLQRPPAYFLLFLQVLSLKVETVYNLSLPLSLCVCISICFDYCLKDSVSKGLLTRHYGFLTTYSDSEIIER